MTHAHNEYAKFQWSMCGVLLWCVSLAAQGGVVDPLLRQALRDSAADDQVPVIIHLADRVRPESFQQSGARRPNPQLIRALRNKAALTQGPVRQQLQLNGAQRIRPLWIVNGIAAQLRPAQVEALAARADVASVELDQVLQAPGVTYTSAGAPEWNVAAIRAPQLWSLGYTGTGVVVAGMDTGADYDHPDLSATWRGGTNSWYDPHGEHSTPHDSSGHGTQTLSLVVGGAAGGTAIGVAPDARWIAVKLFDDAGQAALSDIHFGFQWLLDPDSNPATGDAPDVVNASWGLNGTSGACVPEFHDDIQALKAAGIAIVFSAGNGGPYPSSSTSPANDPQALAVGAVDAALNLADFSSRGPSACDGGVFPQLAGPGVGVTTADLSFGGLPLYATVSGTSYAAPHVSGALALLMSARPDAGLAELETALTAAARDLGEAGADNGYGYGLVDVAAAYERLGTASNQPPAITSAPETTATQGQAYSYQVMAQDPEGGVLTYALAVSPTGMTIDAGGLISVAAGRNGCG